MTTKKTVLISSGLLSALALISGIFEPFRLCGIMQRDCMHFNYIFFLVICPSLPLFLFSLITYFLPERFFRAWYKFALAWTALAMIGILLAPEYSGQLMYAITKGSVAFYTTVLFCIISSAILIFKLFRHDQ